MSFRERVRETMSHLRDVVHDATAARDDELRRDARITLSGLSIPVVLLIAAAWVIWECLTWPM